MRAIDSDYLAALEESELREFKLLELDLPSGAVYYTDCDVPIGYISNETIDPIGYWRMNGDATDETDNANDGTLYGTYSWVAGNPSVEENAKWIDGKDAYFIGGERISWLDSGSNEAVELDGASGYIDCGSDNIFDFTSSDFTVSFLVYFNALTSWHRIISRGELLVSGWHISASSTGRIYLETYQNFAVQFTYTEANAVTTGKWYHILVAKKEGDATIYVDNVNKVEVAGHHIDPESYSGSLTFGKYSDDSSHFLDGRLDEIQIFDTGLSSGETSDLYNYGIVYIRRMHTPKQFSISDINYSSESIVDSVKLVIEDLDAVLKSTFVDQILKGYFVTIKSIILGADFSPVSDPVTLFIGEYDPFDIDEEELSLTSVSINVRWSKNTMIRQSPTCVWRKFKGTRCGYAGSETWCDRTWARCESLANTDNFVGERWLPSIIGTQIWWGVNGK